MKRAEIAAAPRRNAGRHDDSDDDPLDELSVGHLTKLIAIIDGLWKHLPPSSDQLKTEYEFLLRLCKEQAISKFSMYAVLTLALYGLCFRRRGGSERRLEYAIANASPNGWYWKFTARIGEELASCIGQPRSSKYNIRQSVLLPTFSICVFQAVEIVADPDVVYSSVVSRTSTVITAVLIQSFDEWREDCSFVIDHIRQNAMSAKNNKGNCSFRREGIDDLRNRSICPFRFGLDSERRAGRCCVGSLARIGCRLVGTSRVFVTGCSHPKSGKVASESFRHVCRSDALCK